MTRVPRLAVALAALAVGAVVVPGAAALRAPTPAELHSLKAALVRDGGLYGFSFARISTVDPRYASLRYFAGNPETGVVLRRRVGSMWKYVYDFGLLKERGDGACAFVPAAVVRDLLGLTCPPSAALHARHATAAETVRLVKTFRVAALTSRWAPTSRLEQVCISRHDASAAAARIAFPSTSGIVWFRRTGARWLPVYETVASKGVRPSPAIVLSLASCVGYNAAQYGG